MKKALVFNDCGLGDQLISVPAYRKLSDTHEIDLICRKGTVGSGLLSGCSWFNNFFEVDNYWKVEGAREEALKMYDEMKKDYDWHGKSLHEFFKCGEHKSEGIARELGIDVTDWGYEAFISEEDQLQADEILDGKGNVLFVHCDIELHEYNSFDGWGKFAEENLTGLYDSVIHGKDLSDYPINVGIAVAKDCEHAIVCNSVYAHGLAATHSYVDLLVHPSQDRKVFPIKCEKVLAFMELGEFLKRDDQVWSMYDRLKG